MDECCSSQTVMPFVKGETDIISIATQNGKRNPRSANGNTKSGVFSGAVREQTKMIDVKIAKL